MGWVRLGRAGIVAVVLGGLVSPAVKATTGASSPCGQLTSVQVSDAVSCTHGPDPFPSSSTPVVAAEAVTAAAPVPCYGDGISGKRVQAIYAWPADRPDRSAEVIPQIHGWAADVDAVFDRSAAQTGGSRHIRFVTTPDCVLDVQRVPVSAGADDSLAATLTELAAGGFNRSDRKYVVWMDSTVLCGIANLYVDDRPDADNVNNGSQSVPGNVARIDSGCWGLAGRGQSVEAHELLHVLGGVQPSAPHATALGHCRDESDRMCYDDGSPGYQQASSCPTGEEPLLDCGDDDYFSTEPASTSYLASHWNTASSAFLEASAPAPPPADTITRLGGVDRIATAIAASVDVFAAQSATAALLSTGLSFADALAGGAAAAEAGGAILLTNGTVQAAETAAYLARHPTARRVALGGPAASADPLAERVVGNDRYETAAQVARAFFAAPSIVGLASGAVFPDALAGGANIAAHGGPVLLAAPQTPLPAPLVDYVTTTGSIARAVVYGGPAAVSNAVVTDVARITSDR